MYSTVQCTRGSIWFQVSDMEDDAEQVRIEAYMLKKISKDPPLHPIPVAFKWDHLPDIKLADSDFRTLAALIYCSGLKYSRAYFVISSGLDLEAHHPQLTPGLGGGSLAKLKVTMW